jgi:hypothetical protein
MFKWLFSLIALCIPLATLADTPSLVITEIAATLPSNQEWIELYNATSDTIDLNGWKFAEGVTPSNPDGTRHSLKLIRGDFKIEAGEYAVIANSAEDFLSTYGNYAGTLIDSSWSSLKEEGELIWLENATGAIIEKFTYIPTAEGVLARIDAYTKDYTAANWAIVPGDGTPGKKNEIGNITPTTPIAPDTSRTTIDKTVDTKMPPRTSTKQSKQSPLHQ